MTGIEDSAFAATGITSFKVENGCNLDYIGDNAFYECPLEEMTLPATIKYIGKKAFFNCELTTINFEGTKSQWNAIYLDFLWKLNSSLEEIVCIDGVINIDTSYGEALDGWAIYYVDQNKDYIKEHDAAKAKVKNTPHVNIAQKNAQKPISPIVQAWVGDVNSSAPNKTKNAAPQKKKTINKKPSLETMVT